MAKSRNYTKLIQLWKTTTVTDGYGGNIVTTELVYPMWANVVAKSGVLLNENGQNDNVVSVLFTVRNNPNINISVKNNFIKYKGLEYNIDGVLKVDLDNIDIQINGSQRT